MSEPVEVDGEIFTEVTMSPFKGKSVIAFRARRQELVEGGDGKAAFVLCAVSSGVPTEVFEEMDLGDYLPIKRFMEPHFEQLLELVGNAPKPASKNRSS